MQLYEHQKQALEQTKNWSQEVLSKKTGISLATLKRKLRNNNGWTLLEAVAIAEAFGVSVEELFFTRMIPSGNNC